jgi:hypothetical protein
MIYIAYAIDIPITIQRLGGKIPAKRIWRNQVN